MHSLLSLDLAAFAAIGFVRTIIPTPDPDGLHRKQANVALRRSDG
jgi:hypothetical protein